MQISMSIQDIVSGVQVPDNVQDLPDGGQEMTFLAESEDKALPLARKLVRELTKFRVTDFTGTRDKAKLVLRFGQPGAVAPASWTAKKSSSASEKPAILAAVKIALVSAGFSKVLYYNSGSVTQKEGLVVTDDRIPVGLQFAMDENDDLIARTLLNKNTWFEAIIDGPADAVRIAKNATRLFDLS